MAESNGHSDEEYKSASDEDFNPHTFAADENWDSSDNESKHKVSSPKGGKKLLDEAEDVGFENSGDEATIFKGHKKKRKLNDTRTLDEEDGEGLIKTRSQRRQEKQKKKPLLSTSKPSVDVDALWAQMSSASKQNEDNQVEEGSRTSIQDQDPSKDTSSNSMTTSTQISSTPAVCQDVQQTSTSFPNNTITIKRTYEFAGEKMEEERTVSADSAEARLYKEQQLKSSQVPRKPGVRRPVKRKSIFDTSTAITETEQPSGSKLNTLEKSKLDWAQHVDSEGLSEELDEHRRGKNTYLGRMDFLGRMDAKREADIKKTTSK